MPNHVCLILPQIGTISKFQLNPPKYFLEFLQYAQFLAYLRMKAGFWDCLLNNIQAEDGGKEVFAS